MNPDCRDQERDDDRASRRAYLALGASGVLAGLGGCLGVPGTATDAESVSTPEGGIASSPTGDVDLPVSEDELVRGAGKDAIPAIVDPVFGDDWSGLSFEVPNRFPAENNLYRTIEPRLDDDDLVVGVTRNDEARAYPLAVLNWHEIVNDSFHGPLLVTYCPLCGSAIVAKRRVDGEPTIFGVSGLLFRENLLMYDEATGSLWSQILARAIRGPQTERTLELVPFTTTTLGEWRESHPDTEVLRPPPDSNTVNGKDAVRNYDVNPYSGYEGSNEAGLQNEFDDDRLPPKATVIGVTHDDVARAYPAETVRRERLIEDEVGGLPVVVTTTPGGTPVAWVRRVDGETLTFTIDDERHLGGGDSLWNRSTGEAVDGPHEGTRLTKANAVSPLFWFSWLDFQPDTDLYRDES